MGFEVPAYKLVWPKEARWNGLEVRMRGMSIGELEKVAALKNNLNENEDNLERLKPLLSILEDALLSWNVEKDGEPVPVSEFRKQEAALLIAIIFAWTEVVGDVPTPLPQNSSDGKKSEEALMPMEIPSESLPNLNTQS